MATTRDLASHVTENRWLEPVWQSVFNSRVRTTQGVGTLGNSTTTTHAAAGNVLSTTNAV